MFNTIKLQKVRLYKQEKLQAKPPCNSLKIVTFRDGICGESYHNRQHMNQDKGDLDCLSTKSQWGSEIFMASPAPNAI